MFESPEHCVWPVSDGKASLIITQEGPFYHNHHAIVTITYESYVSNSNLKCIGRTKYIFYYEAWPVPFPEQLGFSSQQLHFVVVS